MEEEEVAGGAETFEVAVVVDILLIVGREGEGKC